MNIASAPALGIFIAAAFFEIAGCFAFWAWLRLGKSIWWLAPGATSLVIFAWLLTLAPTDAAGRAYACKIACNNDPLRGGFRFQ